MNSTTSMYYKKQVQRKERDPLQRIVTLMNQYHSIDLMDGTRAEKEWAKERLETQIKKLANHISTHVKGDIFLSLKSKANWERVRNIIG
ncbi:MAG: hypothetical protein KJO69_09195 [Gammaproteobacteria bacterium]|nr:hypothetical protein [Gammaproteobacteria bacterium]